MSNVCGKCKSWRKEQYWNALHSNKKQQFFKIMLGDFETELRIPMKFKSEFKGELLEEVKLRGPSGNIWTTKIGNREQGAVFRHGWEIFVKDHGLEATDFLVFQYSGNSCFDVLIFDPSGCEREDAYFVVRNDHDSSISTEHCCSMRETVDLHTNAGEGHVQDGQKPDSIGSPSSDENDNVSAEKSPTKRKRGRDQAIQRKNGTDTGDFSRAMTVAETRQTGESKNQEDEKTGTDAQCSDESRVKMDDLVDDQEDQQPFSGAELDARAWLNKGNRIRHLISSRRDASRQEKIDVLKRAREQSKTKLPSCHILMKPSHVSHGFTLTIPKWFANLYLPKESQGIELRVPPGEKTWEVQFKRGKQQCTLNKGWAEFVLDNNLEVSDVCVLALPAAKKGKMSTDLRVKRMKSALLPVNERKNSTVLNVSIFRVVEDISELKVF